MGDDTIFSSSTPAEGWTASLGLDTGLISYRDMISPEFYELEREGHFSTCVALRRPRRSNTEEGYVLHQGN